MTPVHSSPRARYQQHMRQRQTIVFGSVGAVLFVLLVFCTLFWLNVIPFPFNREFSRAPELKEYVPCVAENTDPVAAADITVRVYNASNVEGLAAKVAETFSTGGITVSETANWAGDGINDPVVIYTSKNGTAAAYTVRAFLPTAKVIYDPNLVGEEVDVVLGAKWNGDNDLVGAPAEEDFSTAMTPIKGCTAVKDIPDDSMG